MSNKDMIQKLTLGTDDIQTVNITWEDEELEFKLRPLTSGELSKLQVIEKKPLQIKVNMRNGKREAVQSNMNDVDINTGEFTEAQAEAMYKAVALSLSVDGEKVTTDMVKNMIVGLPELLFTEVINVSRLSDADLTMVKQFRKNEWSHSAISISMWWFKISE